MSVAVGSRIGDVISDVVATVDGLNATGNSMLLTPWQLAMYAHGGPRAASYASHLW